MTRRSSTLKNREKKESLSRRNFLSGSVAATVASIASPGKLPAFALEKIGQGMASTSSDVTFRSGKPIWPKDREKEMNLFVGFRAVFEAPAGRHVYLRMTGCTFYQLYLRPEASR